MEERVDRHECHLPSLRLSLNHSRRGACNGLRTACIVAPVARSEFSDVLLPWPRQMRITA